MDIALFKIIIEATVAVVGVVVTAIIAPLIKIKFNVAQQERIKGWVTLAVNAAQKAFELVPGATEAEKRAYILSFLQTFKIKLTPEQLDIIIDAVQKELGIEGEASETSREMVAMIAEK